MSAEAGQLLAPAAPISMQPLKSLDTSNIFRKPLQPLLSKEPVALLVRHTARNEWRLIGLNLFSSVVEASTEGATLATVFLAVKVLSTSSGAAIDWQDYPVLRGSPGIVNWLHDQPTTNLYIGLLALAVLLQGLQSFSRFLGQVSLGYFAARCRTLITNRIHRQVLSLDFPCASAYKIGELTDFAHIGPEAIRVQIEQTSKILLSVLLIVTYLAVLVSISPWLLLVVALISGLLALIQRRLLPKINAAAKDLSKTQVAISSRMTEDFQGLRLLHSSGQLDEASQRLQVWIAELERIMRGQTRWLAVVSPFASFLPILAVALISGVGWLLLGHENNGVLPSMVTFVLALQRLNGRLGELAGATNYLAENGGRITRLNQILCPVGKQFRQQGGLSIHVLERSIRFEAVGLRYAPELPKALDDICFTLPKGEMLALVGPSGAGKSSIADLLTCLYSPSHGKIWIDDTPLVQLDVSTWQKRLGVVSQDTFLFNTTIAENIAFGTPGATPSKIRRACKAAQATSFIERLPQGYKTIVGERGYRLSGGQRQRLSLARAILREPELLILDEATSALDSQSEMLVQEAIKRFESHHTILIIAHRLSTIVRANQILVMDQGRVVERGRHTDLLAQCGLYAKLWEQQTKSKRCAQE